jgi:acyl transferase domain-containing protein/3-hydroxymyristoyl/3-hydroxydecanoyl-(acyl carrier protein) dehydratase
MENTAIVGLGCLFPGADSTEKYWENLIQCRDCASPLSVAETGIDPAVYYHPVAGTADKIGYNRNGHIRDFHFDTSGYALPAQELETLDNLFKWTLHAAAQALNDSGYRGQPQTLAKTGLLIGNIGMPTHSGKRLMSRFYHQMLTPYLRQLLGRDDFAFDRVWPEETLSDLNLITGGHNATVAAQALGLQGPSYALDAACSSAFYAIKMASDYLASGKADMMLAGAVCHADHIYIDHGFNVLQAFPQKGQSIPFDRTSEGLKAGEGAGVIAMKRYADAIRDNDKIYGVIEAVGLSNDAGSRHMLVPDSNGQQLALTRAYGKTEPDIDYLECHATGTPVGDQIELAAMEAFFAQAPTRPLLGANKGINGHMLTASGMGSLFKVILAMQHNLIPPTPGVQQLVNTPAGQLGLEDVVREARPWPQRDRQKRAGINAFGFGGVNAHLVLSEDHPALRAALPQAAEPLKAEPLALVGIGVHAADTEDTLSLDRTFREGRQHQRPLPATRWLGVERQQDLLATRGIEQIPQGAWIETFEFDCKRFRLPPNVVGPHLLSHLFLLPVAERAFLDAGYALDGTRRNLAVIVAGGVDYSCLRYQARNEISWQLEQSLRSQGIALSEEDLQALQNVVKDSLFPAPYPEGITGGIGNVVASRLAAHLHLNGPAFSLYSEENAAFKAIELAQFLLARHEVEGVLIASCSFGGALENVLWDHQSVQANQTPGDGGSVVVVRREQDAQQAGTPIYAVIDGLAVGHELSPALAYTASRQGIADSASRALQAAGCSAADVDYLELYSGARPGEMETELAALASVYATPERQAPVTVGTLKAHYGHLAAAAGLLGIVKCALQLSQRYLPAVPVFNQHSSLAKQADGRFRLPQQTQEWAQPRGALRRAAVNHIGIDRACSHLLLREPLSGPCAQPAAANSASSGGLTVTVYTGREKPLGEFIINADTLARFAPSSPTQTPAGNILANNIALHHLTRHAQTHLHYLHVQQNYYHLIRQLLAGQDPVAAPLFNEEQVIELTDGLVSNVLGQDYAGVDQYPVRTRMPSPPYLFVSRITALSAKKDRLEPCFIEWEYDIAPDAWFLVDGKTPPFVALESSHAMIVAFTVIGCDHLFKGQLCYRAVDSQTTVYSEMPRAGEMLRGRVNITSFVRAGGVALIAYEYFCYVGDRLVFKLVANSGFFGKREIANARQIDTTGYFARAAQARPFTPLLHCERREFDDAALDALIRGDVAACFGPHYAGHAAGTLCAPDARMLNRVTSIDPCGGAWGLGEAMGEVDIDPDHWVFRAHFKNDPVMPGTFLVEGCEQLVKFFLYYLGLNASPDLVAHTLCHHQYSAKFRGEVKCERDVLRYRLTCKSIDARWRPDGKTPDAIALVFIVEILYRGSVIGLCDNLGAGYTHRLSQDASALTALQTQEVSS